LVDNQDRSSYLPKDSKENLQFVQQDMFEFLKTQKYKTYDAITLFGVVYIFPALGITRFGEP